MDSDLKTISEILTGLIKQLREKHLVDELWACGCLGCLKGITDQPTNKDQNLEQDMQGIDHSIEQAGNLLARASAILKNYGYDGYLAHAINTFLGR
jgi:hypothetical protein